MSVLLGTYLTEAKLAVSLCGSAAHGREGIMICQYYRLGYPLLPQLSFLGIYMMVGAHQSRRQQTRKRRETRWVHDSHKSSLAMQTWRVSSTTTQHREAKKYVFLSFEFQLCIPALSFAPALAHFNWQRTESIHGN